MHLGKRIGAAEMFWDDAGTRTSSAVGLELRLAKRWNEQVSQYDVRKTGEGIGNIQEYSGMEKSGKPCK